MAQPSVGVEVTRRARSRPDGVGRGLDVDREDLDGPVQLGDPAGRARRNVPDRNGTSTATQMRTSVSFATAASSIAIEAPGTVAASTHRPAAVPIRGPGRRRSGSPTPRPSGVQDIGGHDLMTGTSTRRPAR